MPEHALAAQWFPQYLPFGGVDFVDGAGEPSGARGATASLSRSLPNFPILFVGLRINNVFELPAQPTELDMRIYEACKRFLDNEQSVRINLSQQNITAEATFQAQLTGQGGIYWSPFPVPFPMAGANNVSVDVVRLTPYPQIDGELIVPRCEATIIALQARNSEQTMPPMRVSSYDARQYIQGAGQA